MGFKVNFNDPVKVRLTPSGRAVLMDQHNELDQYLRKRGHKGLEQFRCSVDEEGYSTFQIWQLMQTFGPHMVMGCPEPFAAEMIFPNGEQC